MQISSLGQIGADIICSLKFDSGRCYEPDILVAGNNYFAIAYRGLFSDGYVATVKIASNGAIAASITGRLVFDSASGYQPNIIHISGNAYAVVYRGTASDGYISTLSIDSNGLISNSLIDTMTYDSSNGYEPCIIHIDGNVYAIAYRSAHQRGYVRTIDITTGGSSGGTSGQSGTVNTYVITSRAAGSSITATVSIVNNLATVLDWNIGR